MLSYYLCSSNQDVLSFIDILDCPLGRFQVKSTEFRQGNRQELLNQPMRVQIAGLPHTVIISFSEKINAANKDYSDWLGRNH